MHTCYIQCHTHIAPFNGRLESEGSSPTLQRDRGDSWERRAFTAKEVGVASQQCGNPPQGTKLFVKNVSASILSLHCGLHQYHDDDDDDVMMMMMTMMMV